MIFPEIIGQESAKRKMGFLIESHKTNGFCRPVIFTGPKGQGKTKIAKSLASHLISKAGTPKKFIHINCASLSTASVSSFIDNIYNIYVGDNEVTLFFDEASALSSQITFALLTILDPDKVNVDFAHGGQIFNFDLKKISWIFATSEPHKIFHALMDRFQKIDLKDYSKNELALIIEMNLKKANMSFDSEATIEAASVCRGNGRSAVGISESIITRLKTINNPHFTLQIWRDLYTSLGLFPLGLTEREIIVLKVLEKNGEGCSLTKLSACTGMTPSALRTFVETYLLQMGFIKVVIPNGRLITPLGKKYLTDNASECSIFS